jgi:hypothetical protein
MAADVSGRHDGAQRRTVARATPKESGMAEMTILVTAYIAGA